MKKIVLIGVLLLIIIFLVISCNNKTDYTNEGMKEYLISKGFEVTDSTYEEEYSYYDASITNFTMRIYESTDPEVLDSLKNSYKKEAATIFDDYVKNNGYKSNGSFSVHDEDPESDVQFVGVVIPDTHADAVEAEVYMCFYYNIKENLLITAYLDRVQEYDKKVVEKVLDKYFID